MKLVLLSRLHCSLCDAFEEELNAFLQTEAVRIENYEKQDVDSDAVLKQHYGNDVPVLMLNDQVVCQHFFDKDKTLKALG